MSKLFKIVLLKEVHWEDQYLQKSMKLPAGTILRVSQKDEERYRMDFKYNKQIKQFSYYAPYVLVSASPRISRKLTPLDIIRKRLDVNVV